MRPLFALLFLACSSDDPAPAVETPNPSQDGGQTERDGALPGDGSMPSGDAASGDAATPRGQLLMLVGSSDGKVRAFELDDAGKVLNQKETMTEGSPSFLAFDAPKRLVFAVNESGANVRAYKLDPATLALTAAGAAVPSAGNGPTHIALHPSGTHVMVANYGGGSSAVFPVQADGSLGGASDQEPSGSKAHHVTADPSGAFVFVTCLGTNSIQQYRWSAGTLLANGSVTLPGNPGPRHLAFRADSKVAYSINELVSSVTTYSYDTTTGNLTAGATTSSLPTDFSGRNTGAEIATHPSGHSVYASNRGHNSIVHFASNAGSGALTLVGHTPTGGNTPRSFGVDPAGEWLAVGNQGSANVRVFPLDATGKLGAPLPDVAVPSPTFVGLFRLVR
jgi:6-phosphogluconolactonase